jgi:hypothetical protein
MSILNTYFIIPYQASSQVLNPLISTVLTVLILLVDFHFVICRESDKDLNVPKAYDYDLINSKYYCSMLFSNIKFQKLLFGAFFATSSFHFCFSFTIQTGFPIDCYAFAILELGKDIYAYKPLDDCCGLCGFPEFTTCIKNKSLYLQCASRAHKCTCKCREKHRRELKMSDNSRSRGLVVQRFKGPRICEKKMCDSRSKQCCVENQCVKLNVRKDRT